MEECSTPKSTLLPQLTRKPALKFDALATLPKSPLRKRNKSLFVIAKPDISDKETPNYELLHNITCVNCLEMVNINLIDSHSRKCTTVTNYVQTLHCKSQYEETVFKLKKLETCIFNFINTQPFSLNDRSFLELLLSFCKQEVDDQTFLNLKFFVDKFDGVLSIKIYSDRLLCLLKDLQSSARSYEIDQKNSELMKLKTEISRFKRLEISSDLSSHKSSFVTTYMSTEDEMIKGQSDIEDSCITPAENDNLQQSFYSLCLSYKFKNSKNPLISQISCKRLYESAAYIPTKD